MLGKDSVVTSMFLSVLVLAAPNLAAQAPADKPATEKADPSPAAQPDERPEPTTETTPDSSKEPAPERAPAKRRPKIIHPDPSQGWLLADQFSVRTAGGAPKLRIRFRNNHQERTADEIKPLGAGTARDDHGVEYKVFTLGMVDTLEPQKSVDVEYSVLPGLASATSALLVLLNPLNERVLYAEMSLSDGEWQLEDYGFWKEERAYFNQNDWAAERLKEKPYKQAAEEVRMWTDISGEFTVRASFVDFELDRATGKSTVSLKREDDGKVIKVPHLRLSAADHKYIRELRKKQREE
jgi:hypothetical protein